MDEITEFIQHDSSIFYWNFPCELPNITKMEDTALTAAYIEQYLKTDAVHKTAPAFFYYCNGPMLSVEALKFDEETMKYLNKHGLHFYLTEPLCSHIINDPLGKKGYHNYNFGFYSEFPNEGLETKYFRSKELDSIFKLIVANGLSNVVVHTCDFGVEKYYPLYTKNGMMTLLCDDLFCGDLKVYNNINFEPKTEIKKKFICSNWRYTTTRWIMSSLLREKDCYLAWYFQTPPEFLDKSHWASEADASEFEPEFFKLYKEKIIELNEHVPLYIDLPARQPNIMPEHAAHYFPTFTENQSVNEGMNPVAINEDIQPLNERFRHTFLDIVVESRFAQPTGNWSEKVHTAIQYQTPFILVAPPHTLKYLKTYGYKTFDKWWDESYDEEENHIKRLKKIWDLIESLDKMSHEEMFALHQEMAPVLEHNLQMAIQNSPQKELSIAYKKTHTTWHSEWQKTCF